MMSEHPQPYSEVAHLLAQIGSEYEAAQRGLSGLAQGTSLHQFISRRMERLGELHSQLRGLVGDEAMILFAAQLDQVAPEKQTLEQRREDQVTY